MWTQEAVIALAPDAASVKAAQGLVKPAQWPLLGHGDEAVWGECQGSGSKPYQTQVDVRQAAAPTFKCSCPSRKFPCKHGLGLLLLLAQQPEQFKPGPAPAWVSQWLDSRAEKAHKKEEKQREKAEKLQEKVADPQASAKAERLRWAKVDAGIAELQQWLQDHIEQGLGSLSSDAQARWHTMAARLVDAQAPALAARVRACADGLGGGSGSNWHVSLLARMGQLQLACDALARRAALSLPELHDLKTLLVGWAQEKAWVALQGECVADDWLVLGQIQQELDARLTERRVWLHGLHSGKRVLLLDHAYAGKGYDSPWVQGQISHTELVLYPSAAPQRALLTEQAAAKASASDEHQPVPEVQAMAPDEWLVAAQNWARCPWMPLQALLLQGTPWRRDGRMVLRVAHRDWPLNVVDTAGWQLLALSAGQPISLLAECDGDSLTPLHVQAVHSTEQWQAHFAASCQHHPPHAALASLLPIALMGTQRQTWAGLAGGDTALHTLLQDITHADAPPAVALLRAAGVLSLCERIALPPTTAVALPAAAAQDARPVLDDAQTLQAWRELLARVRDWPAVLLINTAMQLHCKGWRLPGTALPQVLDVAQGVVALRPALLHLAGPLGLWLAAQNPFWQFAQGSSHSDAQALWDEGSPAQRLAVLQAERHSQPAAARERLAATFATLDAQERGALLRVLGTGLSAEDAPFLMSLLKDRSADVRLQAQLLLAHLPESELAQRASTRMAACLQRPLAVPQPEGMAARLFKAVLGSGAPTQTEHKAQQAYLAGTRISPPTQADAAWKADGIEAKLPKSSPLGERAWWLQQMARQVPLAWWPAALQAPPALLLEWAAQGDWADSLLPAWASVLYATPPEQWQAPHIQPWVQAFLYLQPKRNSLAAQSMDTAQTLTMLPLVEREAYWLAQLQSKTAVSNLGHWDAVMSQIAAALPAGQYLSEALAQALLQSLQALIHRHKLGNDGWHLRDSLLQLTTLLPMAQWPQLQALLSHEPANPMAHDPVQDMAHECQHIAMLRRSFDALPCAGALKA